MDHVAHPGALPRFVRITWLLCAALLGCSDSHAPSGQPSGSATAPSTATPPMTSPSGPVPKGPTITPPAVPVDHPADLPATKPTFSIRFDGDIVYVDVATPQPLFALSCSGYDPVLEKRVGDAWVALQDDRHPDYNNPGYYLDGEYIQPDSNLGCDYIGCFALRDELYAGRVLEFVKIGMMPPPSDANVANGSPVVIASPADVVETRPIHGALRARLSYETDERCSADPIEATVPFDVPEEGVCCPVGLSGCSSEGPGGGWAPTQQDCSAWSVEFDLQHVETVDAHGCAALTPDFAACCGCQ